MAQHAYMIGTGIGNLAAGIYLIRDGGWDGSQITMLGLETHGANDGQATKDFVNEYGHGPLSNACFAAATARSMSAFWPAAQVA